MVSVNTCGEGGTISSFANRDKLCPIILNYAHLTCQDLYKVAKYLCKIWNRLTVTNVA